MAKKSKLRKWFESNLEWIVVAIVALVCAIFLVAGHLSENGKYITLDGNDAQISDTTKEWIESAEEALARIMNEDRPTDDETVAENDEVGLGFYTTIEDILGRRLPDGSSPYQCSRYTAYLATGKSVYSTSHPDYGPVNGKDVAQWLVNNYGFKYIDTPVPGAIGSGGFNTTYGHTLMLLSMTGANTALVNDANYTPLKVATHEMNISGYRWVVPGSYEPTPEPTPQPSPEPSEGPSGNKDDITHTVKAGETLGGIIQAYGYAGSKLFGDEGLAERVAKDNGIKDRGRIYPGQTIVIDRKLFNVY